MKKLLLISAAVALVSCAQSVAQTTEPAAQAKTVIAAETLFNSAWTESETKAVLDKTMRIRFAYDASDLTANERAAVDELLLAGERLHDMYMGQVHPDALRYKAMLDETDNRQDIKDVFRISKGPVATTLDNDRQNIFTGTEDGASPNVYPQGVARADIDAFIALYPSREMDILHPRGIVKAATEANKQAALAVLDARPALSILHPKLREHILTAKGYFALPYSIAYAEDIFYVYDRLLSAAELMKDEDPAFSRFLRLRAVDLLTDNYDGGDATWVSANFKGKLNAQIGSYETYDDSLYGVKTYFSLSLLKRDVQKSDELAEGITDIQSIEDQLPYKARKTVRSRIPVGVYNVIADFGQARGTNTATILPNESHLSRQFGRTILIRSNVLMNEDIFAEGQRSFNAALADKHHADLTLEGAFYRTLWHEIGHYLGPDQTKTGGDIDAALQTSADLFEEMKADLVSLFAARKLYETGAYTDDQFRSIQAGGVLRVLLKSKPRRSQPYQTMQLIQFNWYRDKGLLKVENGKIHIDYDKYDTAIATLLEAVLDIQYEGDRAAAEAFVDKWATWDESLHGQIGASMKAAETSRYRLVTYEALGE